MQFVIEVAQKFIDHSENSQLGRQCEEIRDRISMILSFNVLSHPITSFPNAQIYPYFTEFIRTPCFINSMADDLVN